MKITTTTVALFLMWGCNQADITGTQVRTTPTDPPTQQDSNKTAQNSYAISTSADLPACDSSRSGQLFYIEDINEFRTCKASGWQAISIQGAPGAAGATLTSINRCFTSHTLNGVLLAFEYTVYVMSNNDVMVDCSVSDPRSTFSRNVMYKHTQTGAQNGYCSLTYDGFDGSLSAGYWTFQYASGVPTIKYNDTGSAFDQQTYLYLASECTSY